MNKCIMDSYMKCIFSIQFRYHGYKHKLIFDSKHCAIGIFIAQGKLF